MVIIMGYVNLTVQTPNKTHINGEDGVDSSEAGYESSYFVPAFLDVDKVLQEFRIRKTAMKMFPFCLVLSSRASTAVFSSII